MALRGVKVVELAGLAPAPFCGMILADFGASVIHVDKANNLTDIDRLGRGKRSIALNLKHSSAVSVMHKLCASADVLIDPYRPGVLEKLGLGPSVLLAENPSLVLARLTGYGQTGEMNQRAGHDINYVAMSGVLNALQWGGAKPSPPVNLLADFAGGGLLCAFGIVSALFERQRSGKGQVVDLSLTEGAAYVSSWLFRSKDLGYCWAESPGHNLLDGGFPLYDTYETSDHRYMAVGALEPQFQMNLFEKLGLDFEPQIPFSSGLTKCRESLTKIFKMKSMKEWTEIFQESDACVTPVLTAEEAVNHRHNKQRDLFMKTTNGVVSPMPAPKLSSTPAIPSTHQDCQIASDTFDVLMELGYSKTDINEMEGQGAVVLAQKQASKL